MGEQQDFIKIDNGKLGCINLNNMLPIPQRYLHIIDPNEIENISYRRLIYLQLDWLEKNQLKINNKARNLYYLITENKATTRLLKRCCDFKLLEQKCREYMEINSIREEEILYKV